MFAPVPYRRSLKKPRQVWGALLAMAGCEGCRSRRVHFSMKPAVHQAVREQSLVGKRGRSVSALIDDRRMIKAMWYRADGRRTGS